MAESNCPCQSSRPYAECCQPLHLGREAHSAEQLMRARYSAYCLALIDFIVHTTLPAQQALLEQPAIRQWSKETNWCGLEVLQHWTKVDACHAQVEFKAYYLSAQGREAHHEKSSFVLSQQTWYFLDPTVAVNTSMKQPCFCGSKKKFKHCCAAFL